MELGVEKIGCRGCIYYNVFILRRNDKVIYYCERKNKLLKWKEIDTIRCELRTGVV